MCALYTYYEVFVFVKCIDISERCWYQDKNVDTFTNPARKSSSS